MNFIISLSVPIIVISITTYGILKGVKVYECFIEGAKEGLYICFKIFPYLLAMIFAVTLVRESGLMNAFIEIIRPVLSILGIPSELVPLILIKPLSGSGALGVFTETINQYGTDTFIGIAASIIMGSTETIFYTVSVYYGSVKIKKIRHTLWAAIFADMTAIIMAVTITRFLFE